MTQSKDSQRSQEIQALINEPDFLKGLLQGFLQEHLETEITEFLQAAPYERVKDRKGHRNGYKPRMLRTRVGTLNLLVPKDREGRFQTSLFKRYQRSEKALVLALQEMYLQGVSTRKVTEITEALCGTEFSKSQVSALTAGLDVELDTWRNRPLDGEYPFLIVDAQYHKVRENHRVISKGILTVVGISKDGYREILAVECGITENETTWATVFNKLYERGLRGVLLVTSDDHKGLVKAINRYFQGCQWHRCQVHYLRNLLDLAPKKLRKALADKLKDIFNAPDREQAQLRVNQLIDLYENKYPQVAEFLENTSHEVLACFNFPEEHRKRIRTTNGLERFHEEIRRRTRVVRIFPNQSSCLRLVSALAAEQHDTWISGKRYLTMEPLYEKIDNSRKQEPIEPIPLKPILQNF
ncbi:MAG: IS256 family transposase [Bacteroidales bacterium]|jgi:putative transposase|nr:IS256 family transposase [Bacteroidales bacterium]